MEELENIRLLNDNMITFIMFGKENKGEIKEESIIMENGEVWKKKK
jgi:cbb3-type cytochrome oxidase subunit 3